MASSRSGRRIAPPVLPHRARSWVYASPPGLVLSCATFVDVDPSSPSPTRERTPNHTLGRWEARVVRRRTGPLGPKPTATTLARPTDIRQPGLGPRGAGLGASMGTMGAWERFSWRLHAAIAPASNEPWTRSSERSSCTAAPCTSASRSSTTSTWCATWNGRAPSSWRSWTRCPGARSWSCPPTARRRRSTPTRPRGAWS